MADKKEGEGEGKGGEGLRAARRAQLPEKEGEQARAAGAHTYLKATTKGKKKKEGGNREGRGEIVRAVGALQLGREQLCRRPLAQTAPYKIGGRATSGIIRTPYTGV